MTSDERNRVIQNAAISLGISAPVGVGATEAWNRGFKALEESFPSRDGKSLSEWAKMRGLKRVGIAAATAVPLAVGAYLALNKLTKPLEDEEDA